jgi:hypothetical protein
VRALPLTATRRQASPRADFGATSSDLANRLNDRQLSIRHDEPRPACVTEGEAMPTHRGAGPPKGGRDPVDAFVLAPAATPTEEPNGRRAVPAMTAKPEPTTHAAVVRAGVKAGGLRQRAFHPRGARRKASAPRARLRAPSVWQGTARAPGQHSLRGARAGRARIAGRLKRRMSHLIHGSRVLRNVNFPVEGGVRASLPARSSPSTRHPPSAGRSTGVEVRDRGIGS